MRQLLKKSNSKETIHSITAITLQIRSVTSDYLMSFMIVAIHAMVINTSARIFWNTKCYMQ